MLEECQALERCQVWECQDLVQGWPMSVMEDFQAGTGHHIRSPRGKSLNPRADMSRLPARGLYPLRSVF